MDTSLVDHLLLSVGSKPVLATPLTFLIVSAGNTEETFYKLEPVRMGRRLDEGVLVFKEGFPYIEAHWFKVLIPDRIRNQTHTFHTMVQSSKVMSVRSTSIGGMAIKRTGTLSNIVEPAVWFQDEADSVEYRMMIDAC